MKRVYLAARYSRAEELRGYRDQLKALGVEVTSRWIDHHDATLEKSLTPEQLAAHPIVGAAYAQADIEDLLLSDTLIAFTETGGGKGGRHVELGLGLAKRIGGGSSYCVIVIGPRENIFTTLPYVEHYDAWEAFLNRVVDEVGVPGEVV